MKVTTDLRPTTEVDFEMVRDVSMAWVRLPDLTKLEAEMRLRGLEADAALAVKDPPSLSSRRGH